jgi:hypothetical protein
MKKFFHNITGKDSQDDQVHDDNTLPVPQEGRSFKSPADLARESYMTEGVTPEEQGGPVISETYSPTYTTYNRPEDGIFNRPMFVAKWITDHCQAVYNPMNPPSTVLRDGNFHRHFIANQIINQSRLAITEPPTIIHPVVNLPSKSPKITEGEEFTNVQEAVPQHPELARTFSESTQTTITPATLIQQADKSPSNSNLDLPAKHSTLHDSTVTVTAAIKAFDDAVLKLKTVALEPSPEPKSIPTPAELASASYDSLAFPSMMQAAGLPPTGAALPTDLSSHTALASATLRPIPMTNYTPSIDHLVMPRQPGQVQIRKSQLECHGRHGGWHGPRPNGVHCVQCLLCLYKANAIFQCRFCAMVVCRDCRGKVDEVMARPANSDGGGVGGAGTRGGLALGGAK